MRVTDHHTIHTSKGWRKVGSLREGDQITSAQGESSEVGVLRICQTGARVPVYNLHCRNGYNFVANGVIAHTFTTLRTPRVALNRIADNVRALRVEVSSNLKAAASALLTPVRMATATFSQPRRETTLAGKTGQVRPQGDNTAKAAV